MKRPTIPESLTFPTALSERLAKEDGVFYTPRRLTAMARRGEIPSITTADGRQLIKDGPTTREVLRAQAR